MERSRTEDKQVRNSTDRLQRALDEFDSTWAQACLFCERQGPGAIWRKFRGVCSKIADQPVNTNPPRILNQGSGFCISLRTQIEFSLFQIK